MSLLKLDMTYLNISAILNLCFPKYYLKFHYYIIFRILFQIFLPLIFYLLTIFYTKTKKMLHLKNYQLDCLAFSRVCNLDKNSKNTKKTECTKSKVSLTCAIFLSNKY